MSAVQSNVICNVCNTSAKQENLIENRRRADRRVEKQKIIVIERQEEEEEEEGSLGN